jgi:hypothetical protein
MEKVFLVVSRSGRGILLLRRELHER